MYVDWGEEIVSKAIVSLPLELVAIKTEVVVLEK